MVRRTADGYGQLLPLAEIAVDLRQADAARLPDGAGRGRADAERRARRQPRATTSTWTTSSPYRDCLIWEFNRLFWRHLADWEAASGKGFEAALPGGLVGRQPPGGGGRLGARRSGSASTRPQLKGQLPPEIVGLEIGVGTGARAASWLDKFKALDAEAGTGYYDRMHFLLGDYSPTSLERALAAVEHHDGHVQRRAARRAEPVQGRSAPTGSRSCTSTRPTSTTTCRSTTWCGATASCTWWRCGRISTAPRPTGWWPISACRARSCPGRMRQLLDGGPFAVFPRRARRGVLARVLGRLQARGAAARARRARRRPRAARPEPDAPGGPAGRGARRRALPRVARRRRELRQHAAAAAPARLPRGAGHLRRRHGRLPQGLPRPRQARRLARDLGERRAAARGRRARGLRRALRAVPVPPRHEDHDSLHHATD